MMRIASAALLGTSLACLLLSGCGNAGLAPESDGVAQRAAEYDGESSELRGLPPIAHAVPESKSESESRNGLFPDLRVVNGEAFADMYFEHYGVNPTIDTAEESSSTFSVDVDTASYAIARGYLERGHLPPEAAIRVEEFVNAQDYHYAAPEESTFAVQAEAVPSPSRPGYHLLHLGLQGRHIDPEERRPAQLVFVIDVSGSMNRENRLGLVKRSLRVLVDQLQPEDKVGIVVYGSRGRALLDPTGDREQILEAIERLRPEGSTNAHEGLVLGYKMAERHLVEGGINRLILCSDGVANTGGPTSAEGIFESVRAEVEKGITISTFGFGMGNFNDVLMERLAKHGHGNYHYVDSFEHAQRLFGKELSSHLEVIAQDVKIQVDFDPDSVSRFRLLGYENRRLENEDFEDDFVPAGFVGPGHSVTALYEVKLAPGAQAFGTFRVRYKEPGATESTLIEKPLPSSIVRASFGEGSGPLRSSVVAALFAEKLRGSYWVRMVEWGEVVALWDELPDDLHRMQDVAQLGELIRTARRLDQRGDKFAAEVSLEEMDFDRIPVLR